jgi:aryl-alcohol dehydrogenase-like predicted oxidoreductase
VRRHSRWNFLPRVLELAVEGSLRRLGTDYLDVFYLHNPPRKADHLAENVAAVESLSSAEVEALRAAANVPT